MTASAHGAVAMPDDSDDDFFEDLDAEAVDMLGIEFL